MKIVCPQHGGNCDMRCKDPNVDNGMMTKVWGPAGWLLLHCVTFGYPYTINPDNLDHAYKKDHYKSFFNMVGHVLPCKYCRESYIEFSKETPIDNFLDTRDNLCRWLYIIHNKVNNKLGVGQDCIPTFKEVQEFYEKFRAKCKKTSDAERISNKEKGCIKPADGTPKKCVINVVKYNDNDNNGNENSIVYDASKSDSPTIRTLINSISNWKNWIIPFIILALLNILYLTKSNYSSMF